MKADGFWETYARQRASRRRVLQASGVAAVATGAAWLVGCSGDDGNGSPTTATAGTGAAGNTGVDYVNPLDPPVAGRRYHVAAPASFDSFDPHRGVAAAVPLFPRIYNVLVNQSATRPTYQHFDLAQSLENPDDVTWVFKIRRGVRVGPNDLGVPERDLDAEDAAATFERIKTLATAPNGAFVKEFVQNAAASGDTLTITTTKPYAWFLSRVGNFVNTIPPRELIADDAGVEKMSRQSAGGGPYRLAAATEGEGARFERNPSYYRKDSEHGDGMLPYLDGIDVRVVADRAAWRTAFLGGQLHQYSAGTKQEADEFASNDAYVVVKEPNAQFVPVTMNVEKPPFNDPRARRAVALAVNRQQYIDLVFGGDAKPNGLVHWPVGEGTYAFTADELKELQPYDPAEARRLVEALGGLRVKLIYPSNAPVAQHPEHVPIFLQQMKDAGIELDQQAQDLSTWLENYRTRNYELSLGLTQVIETPEFPLNWHTAKGPAGDGSFGVGLNDPEINAALDKTKTTLDLEDRIAAVRDAQKVLYAKDPGFLPLVSGHTYVVYTSKVHNIPTGVGSTAALISTTWLEA